VIRDAYYGLLYIGDAISARDLSLVYDHRITAVVDLAANEPPATLGRDIVYCRFPLHDDGSNDDTLLSASIECLHLLVLRRIRTLVACSAGMSRSPLIAASALGLLTGRLFPDALAAITTDAPHDVSPALCSSVERVHSTIASRMAASCPWGE